MSNTQSLAPKTVLRSGHQEYIIERVLGAGSFGITYLASSSIRLGNVSMTVHFAIKEHFMDTCYRLEDGMTVNCTPATRKQTETSRADFLTEAKRLQKICLKAPGIVKVNETFEANGTAYYVMEYLDGGNPEPMKERDALKLMIQVADAVAAIHRERMLHLDIKPGNIVMKTTEEGNHIPVLIDFGISKHFDSKGHPTSRIKAKGVSVGYAPQEQYSEINEFSPKYDVYALGGVLFYLLTGKNPPAAFDIAPNMAQIAEKLPADVSEATRKVVLDAMQPQAFNRTPSAEAMIGQLQQALMLLDAPNQPAMPIPAMPQPAVANPAPAAIPKPQPKRAQGGDNVVVAEAVSVAPKPKAQPKAQAKPKPQPKPQPQRVATEPLTRATNRKEKPNQPYGAKRKGSKLPLIIGVSVGVVVAIIAAIALSSEKKSRPVSPDVTYTDSTVVNTSAHFVSEKVFSCPNDSGTFVYTGPVNSQGLPEGKGKGVYELGTYEGYYKNGVREGEAIYRTRDGSNVFEGTYHNDMYDHGKLYFPLNDNMYYEGTFKNNGFDVGHTYSSDGTRID